MSSETNENIKTAIKAIAVSVSIIVIGWMIFTNKRYIKVAEGMVFDKWNKEFIYVSGYRKAEVIKLTPTETLR